MIHERDKMYKRRKRWRKVTNSMWTLLVAVFMIIALAVGGTLCVRYVDFMNREGMPTGEAR